MTHQNVVFNEIPLTFNNEFLTFNGGLPDPTLDLATGWGLDGWGMEWWGSFFAEYPIDAPSHASTTRDRPRVTPRARF